MRNTNRLAKTRESTEDEFRDAQEKEEKARKEVAKLENERRTKSDERAQRLAEYSRLKAQLEVLEQAEQSLAGYAEGARYLLDAARQMRLTSARGALSTSLDVPAELETAVAAALGDTLDAILLDASEIEDALQLLEENETGRAALLPLNDHQRQSLVPPADENFLGVASELVNAPEELRAAVELMLGQTLIVRDRVTARRLIMDFPPHARVVTLRGEVFRGDGLIIAGKSASSSVLSCPRQKRELTESLATLNTNIESLNHDVDALSTRINDVQREVVHSNEAARAARLQWEESQGNEQQARLETETTQRQLEWQRNQFAQLQSEADEAASIRANLIASQAEVESRSVSAQEQIHTFSEQLAGMDLADAQSQASYWGTRVAVVERALEDGRARQEERQREVARFDTRRYELTTRLQQAETSLTGLDDDKSSLRERETTLHTQIEELRVFIEPAEQDLETAEQEEFRLQELKPTPSAALRIRNEHWGRCSWSNCGNRKCWITCAERSPMILVW